MKNLKLCKCGKVPSLSFTKPLRHPLDTYEERRKNGYWRLKCCNVDMEFQTKAQALAVWNGREK